MRLCDVKWSTFIIIIIALMRNSSANSRTTRTTMSTRTLTTTTTKILPTKPTTKISTTKETSSITTSVLHNLINETTLIHVNTETINANGSLNVSSDVIANNTGTIAGVVVGVIILLALLVGVFFLRRWRQKQVKETGSSIKHSVNGSLAEESSGTAESSYSELAYGNKGQDSESKNQYYEPDPGFLSENSPHEYSKGKHVPLENKQGDPYSMPIQSADIVQSNGIYSLASVSNNATSPHSEYSSHDHGTDDLKPPQNTTTHISTDDTCSNLGRTRQDDDITTLNYQLAVNINDVGSQSKQDASSLNITPNTQTEDYAVLGDQIRDLTNPYNCASDSTLSSIQALPMDDSKALSYCEKTENKSSDYCVASSLISNDKISYLNSNSSTKFDDVQIVSSEYDLARA